MALSMGARSLQWNNAEQMYETIDSIPRGEVPWNVIRVCFTGTILEPVPPKWKTEVYELYVRDVRSLMHMLLGSPAFHSEFAALLYRQFYRHGSCIFSNLMSADWAWKQCVSLLLHTEMLLTHTQLRIHWPKILQITDQCWYQSLLEVTRQQSQSQLGIKISTLFTSLLVIWQTLPATVIYLGWRWEPSFQYQKVCREIFR